MSANDYKPEVCGSCTQTKTYVLSVDHGTVDILKAISRFVEKKGINIVHVEKEMVSGGFLTTNQYTNLKRLTAHGLIAKADERANYHITTKGHRFLQGEPIPKHAIMSKVTKKQIGYFQEEETVTVGEFNGGGEYWEGANYEIREGRVIHRTEDFIKGKSLF